jgi:hypothetical protein
LVIPSSEKDGTIVCHIIGKKRWAGNVMQKHEVFDCSHFGIYVKTCCGVTQTFC